MKGSKLLGAAAVCLVIAAVACAKDGATGPQGPAGPQGDSGATGSPNVIYSAWFKPSTYTVDTIFGVINLNAFHEAPGITQAILDSGVVLTYGKLNGYNPVIWPTGQVAQLPIVLTYMQGATTYTDTWSAYATVDSLRINFVDNQNFYTSISTVHQFRYVIIPGGVLGDTASASVVGRMHTVHYTRDQLRAMPYETIARLFKIPRD